MLTDHPPLRICAAMARSSGNTGSLLYERPSAGSRGCYANCSFCCIAAVWHQRSSRYALSTCVLSNIADEMVAEKKGIAASRFCLHDDNFFVQGISATRRAVSALADALQARGIGRFATVVKARPTDADPQVFEILKTRLHCIRMYVGVESDSEQGLRAAASLGSSKQNHGPWHLWKRWNLHLL